MWTKEFRAVLVATGITIALSAAMTAPAFSAPLIDRGLPDQNLNSDAGSDRSNVAWGFEGDFFSGDTFSLGSNASGAWEVQGLRTWAIGGRPMGGELGNIFSDVSLFLGEAGAESIPTVASGNIIGNGTDNADIQITPVTYADGSDYEGSSGTLSQIWQIDFLNLGTFSPGDYIFGITGAGDSAIWFNHASNANLSGTPQDGANNEYNWFAGTSTDLQATVGGVIDSDGDGWDKSSDVNVQVFATEATEVPLPGSLPLLGLGLAGLMFLSRRRTRQL